jgi:hypothetical protein
MTCNSMARRLAVVSAGTGHWALCVPKSLAGDELSVRPWQFSSYRTQGAASSRLWRRRDAFLIDEYFHEGARHASERSAHRHVSALAECVRIAPDPATESATQHDGRLPD